MQNKVKLLLVGSIILLSCVLAGALYALPQDYKKSDNSEQLQAETKRIQQFYDVRSNTVSNIQFTSSNYGIFGYDVARNTGAGYWPRGSLNQYIFGGGIWFGAQKPFKTSDGSIVNKKYVTITYDPNKAKSMMAPGRVIDYNGNEQLLASVDDIWLYRTYLSTEFSRTTGKPYNVEENYSWPIWDVESEDEGYYLGYDRYFGRFINNPNDRTLEKYPKGPAFISEEDIFSTYKDTDLNRYENMSTGKAREDGYPLKMQIEEMIYSWGFGEYKDFIFIKYDIINLSKDTLRDCWLAPIMDVDIARAPYTDDGARNDNVKYYKPKDWEDVKGKSKQDTLNLAFQWTKNDRGEDAKGFGYLGFDFLESPSVHKSLGTIEVIVDNKPVLKNWMWSKFYEVKAGGIDPTNGQTVANDTIIGIERLIYDKELEGFVRKDKRYYETIEQLGLVSFRNWNIDEDKKTPDAQYNFLSEIGEYGYIRDSDERGSGDKRFMMATGPFSMLPSDTVRTVVGIILALPSVNREADGSEEDVQGLLYLDKFAQRVYDNNFRAPSAPENTRFLGYKSYNNAIEIYWDSTAEMSQDVEENGLDFMGYTLYRARDPQLDTFNVNKVAADANYVKGRGPFGWKQVATWNILPPFAKSAYRAEPNSAKPYPYIDDFEIIGLGYDADGNMDTMALTIMRLPAGFDVKYPAQREILKETKPYATPSFYGFNQDTSLANPWVNYFRKYWEPNLKDVQIDPINHYKTQFPNSRFLDSVLIGTIRLNDAMVPYNPLFYIEETVPANAFRKTKLGVGVDGKDSFVIKPVALTPKLMEDNILRQELLVQYRENEQDGYYIYLFETLREIEIQGQSKYYITRMRPLWNNNNDKALRDSSWKEIFKNKNLLDYAKAKLFEMIQNKLISRISFNNQMLDATMANEVIEPYMKKITNGRKYYDFADDYNQNKVVEANESSALTERILNNIEYYYKLEAFDEGDYMQPTESKSNDGSKGRPNNLLAYAKAGRPDDHVKFEITRVDSDKMGGLRNFKFFTIDPDRLTQKLAGRTLIMKLNPYPGIYSINVPGETGTYMQFVDLAFYYTHLTITDSATNEKLFETVVQYNDGSSDSYMNLLTENGFSVIMADTVLDKVSGVSSDFGRPENTEKFTKKGSFTTGMFNEEYYNQSYNFVNGYENIFGVSFDYSFEQHGGTIRPVSIEKVNNSNTSTIVSVFNDKALSYKIADVNSNWDYAGTQIADVSPNPGFNYSTDYYAVSENNFVPSSRTIAKSWNLGPADYLITFKEGGSENIVVTYNNNDIATRQEVSFDVPYLTYEVKNTYSFESEYPTGLDSIKYGFEYLPMELPETATWSPYVTTETNKDGQLILSNNVKYTQFPMPINLKSEADNFVGKFNSFAVGCVNSRNKNLVKPSDFRNALAVQKDKEFNRDAPNLIGKQNRYYMSATNGGNTIDFVNILNISGAYYALDYAQMGKFIKTAQDKIWTVPDYYDKTYGEDFKPGDQLIAKVRGGAFGLPVKGAEVHAKVSAVAGEEYTDSNLDKVKVVPNPYFISHEAQKSAYDTKLYFTKLPKECNIDIYTINGDLVKSIKHAPVEKDTQGFDDGESNSEFDSYRFAMEPWDLYSSNNQRVQSQTFIALISTPNGAKSTVKFTVLVGSTRLITD